MKTITVSEPELNHCIIPIKSQKLNYLDENGEKKRGFRVPGTSVFLYLYDLAVSNEAGEGLVFCEYPRLCLDTASRVDKAGRDTAALTESALSQRSRLTARRARARRPLRAAHAL